MDGFTSYLQTHWLSATLWTVGGILLIVMLARFGRPIRAFSGEVKGELQKASWPWDPKEKGMKKYRELTDSTVIVIIATLLLGGYVAFWDLLMMTLVGFLAK